MLRWMPATCSASTSPSRVDAVRARVGQRTDDVEELDDRAGPAVRDDERERVRLGRPHVEEVDALAVDLRDELVERVEPRLLLAPVVPVPPVLDELAQVAELRAVVPARARDLLGKPRAREALAQVVENCFGDVDREPFDRSHELDATAPSAGGARRRRRLPVGTQLAVRAATCVPTAPLQRPPYAA